MAHKCKMDSKSVFPVPCTCPTKEPNPMPNKTKAAPPSLLDVVKEYAEQIENNPDEGNFRSCCMAEFNYADIGKTDANPHAHDCKAIAAIAAHEAAAKAKP